MGNHDGSTLAVIDAGMISGWRRSTPSLGQLHQAVFHLRTAYPDLHVAVVGDPALKHALPTADQVLLDADIEVGALVMAPAGTLGGFHGFLTRVIEQATERGLSPVVITDRAITHAALGRMRMDGGRFLFDLDAGTITAVPAPRPDAKRSRRRASTRAPKAAVAATPTDD